MVTTVSEKMRKWEHNKIFCLWLITTMHMNLRNIKNGHFFHIMWKWFRKWQNTSMQCTSPYTLVNNNNIRQFVVCVFYDILLYKANPAQHQTECVWMCKVMSRRTAAVRFTVTPPLAEKQTGPLYMWCLSRRVCPCHCTLWIPLDDKEMLWEKLLLVKLWWPSWRQLQWTRCSPSESRDPRWCLWVDASNAAGRKQRRAVMQWNNAAITLWQ